jgi:hypothetical protein
MDNSETKVFIETYEEYLAESFRALWALVDIEYDKLDAYSVIGALLSRQVTLSIEMARSPNTWTAHSAPLFLRAMTDLHITLSWIMLDLVERSTKYILHGLGDEKLVMEHYKKCIEDNPGDEMNEDLEKVVQIKSDWINSQKRDFLVEVNLGHWAQLDYRKMSQEADCEDLYKFAYKPFSQAAHSMWPHVSRLNSKYCESPLHKYHLVPELFDAPLDLDYLYRSCKYVDKAYKCFVEKFSLNFTHRMPLEWWYDYFNNVQKET